MRDPVMSIFSLFMAPTSGSPAGITPFLAYASCSAWLVLGVQVTAGLCPCDPLATFAR